MGGGVPYPGYEPSWPQIDHNERESRISRNEVKRRIDALNDDLAKYTTQHGAPGTPGDVRSHGSAIQANDVGAGDDNKTGYPAGRLIWRTISKAVHAQDGFPAAYEAFVTSYGHVVEALYQNAGIHERKENDSTLPSAPGAGNTDSYGGGESGT